MLRLTSLVFLLLFCVVAVKAAPFSDVPPNHWAYGAIQRAVKAGILKGYDGKYYGDKTLNRYQIAVIIDKMLQTVHEREGNVPPAVGRDLNKLLDEFADEMAMINSRLDRVEARLDSIRAPGLKMIDSDGSEIVCDEKCEVRKNEPSTSLGQVIYSRKGRELKIGGIAKTWWLDQDVADADEFGVRNARLLLIGKISPDVKWVMQTEQANVTGASGIYDFKLMINLDKKDPWATYLQFGRFIPNITRYMPVLINTIDFVRYPLFLSPRNGNNVGIWRQSGLEIYRKSENMKWTFGVLNGSAANDDNWQGDIGGANGNDSKDYFLRADFIPKSGRLKGSLAYWSGEHGVNDDRRTMFDAWIEYSSAPWRALFEYEQHHREDWGDADGNGCLFQVIHHRPDSRFEYLARWENYDPDDDVDDDESQWLTLGVNWLIAGRECFFSLNYIDEDYEDNAGQGDDEEWIGQFTVIF